MANTRIHLKQLQSPFLPGAMITYDTNNLGTFLEAGPVGHSLIIGNNGLPTYADIGNNIVRVVDLGTIGIFPGAPTGLMLGGALSALGLTVDANENVIIEATVVQYPMINLLDPQPPTTYYNKYIWKPGRGVYGNSGTTINWYTDVELIYSQTAPITGITDAITIELGNIEPDDIATYVNNLTGVTYNLTSDDIYFFTTTGGTLEETYLYVGTQPITLGDGAVSAVTLADFSLISQNGVDLTPVGVNGSGPEEHLAIWGANNGLTYDSGLYRTSGASNTTLTFENAAAGTEGKDVDFIIRALGENTRPGLILQHDWSGATETTDLLGVIQTWGVNGVERFNGTSITARGAENWSTNRSGSTISIKTNLNDGKGTQELNTDAYGNFTFRTDYKANDIYSQRPNIRLVKNSVNDITNIDSLASITAYGSKEGEYSEIPGGTLRWSPTEVWSGGTSHGTSVGLTWYNNGNINPSGIYGLGADGRVMFDGGNGGINTYTFPNNRGTSGQTFILDGSGNLSWGDLSVVDTYWTSGSSGTNSLKSINGTTTDATADFAFAVGSDVIASGTYSVAMGNQNSATTIGSVAMGGANIASGIGSFATGSGNTSSGNYSVAMGNQNSATTISSIAMGSGNIANSVYSVAMGAGNMAGGGSSFAAGYLNTTSNQYSVAMGIQNSSSGYGSVAMGVSNTGTTDGSVAMGSSNIVSGIGSFAMGVSNNVSGHYSSTMGRQNSVSGIYSAIIGGSGNTLTGNRSIILGGQGITGTNDNTVYGVNANFSNTISATTFYTSGGTSDDWNSVLVVDRTMSVMEPVAGDVIPFFKAPYNLTIQSIRALNVSGTTPSVMFNIKRGTSILSSLGSLGSATVTGTTSGDTVTVLSGGTVSLNEWVWIEIPTIGSQPKVFTVDLTYKKT